MIRNERVLGLILKTLFFLETFKLITISYVKFYSEIPKPSYLADLETLLLVVGGGVILLRTILKIDRYIAALILGITNLIFIISGIYVYNHFQLLTVFLLTIGLKPLLNFSIKNNHEAKRVISYVLMATMSIVYFFSALSKINQDFINGSIILELVHDELIIPNSQQPSVLLYSSVAVLVILIEFLLSAQFLFSASVLQIIQSLGFLFHLTIIFILDLGFYNTIGLGVFMILSICTYPLFNQENWNQNRWIVFWDSNCSFCAKTIRLAQKTDNLRKFEFRNNTDLSIFTNLPFSIDLRDETIILYNENSKQFLTSSKAIFFLFGNNFFLWPLIGFLNFKTLIQITDFVYAKIASKRYCRLQHL